ncbi:MAG TPA: GDSL-type esterase/lipase family protein, partial [Thermoanaerobaculia bacterium]
MLRKLALAAAAAVLALLAAEGALRLTGAADAGRGAAWYAGGNHPRFLFAPDATTGYRLRPGFEGMDVAATGEFRVPVEIDGLGLRAGAGGGDRAGGVLAVGDSLTFGEGVAAGETFAARLEDALGVPVVNAGVPGYSSRQSAARARELLPRLRPRLVLLTVAAEWDELRCPRPFVYHEGFIVGSGYRDRLHLVDGNLLLEQ